MAITCKRDASLKEEECIYDLFFLFIILISCCLFIFLLTAAKQ